jgi:hypothetical protein
MFRQNRLVEIEMLFLNTRAEEMLNIPVIAYVLRAIGLMLGTA